MKDAVEMRVFEEPLILYCEQVNVFSEPELSELEQSIVEIVNGRNTILKNLEEKESRLVFVTVAVHSSLISRVFHSLPFL